MYTVLHVFAISFAVMSLINSTANQNNSIQILNKIFCSDLRTCILLVTGCTYLFSLHYKWEITPVTAVAELVAIVIVLHGMYKDNGVFGLLRK